MNVFSYLSMLRVVQVAGLILFVVGCLIVLSLFFSRIRDIVSRDNVPIVMAIIIGFLFISVGLLLLIDPFMGASNPPPVPTPTVPATASPSAVVTTTPSSSTSYTAPVPGPGCDDAGGQWVSSNADGVTTLHCSSAGMELVDTNPGNFDTAAEVFFSWPQHPFPAKYTLQADIALSATQGITCAGFTTHRSTTPDTTHQGGYAFYLCSDDSWEVDRFSDTDNSNATTLQQGCSETGPCFSPSNKHHVAIVVNGTSQTFIIDGTTETTFVDTTYTATSQISLYVFGNAVNHSQSGATFSNFVYTLMP
jgi:hypothetical protein